MSDNTYTYDELINLPTQDAWAAMKQTSKLDIMGGQEVIERTSDADWVCRTDEHHTVHCTAEFDEATHTVTVTNSSTAKRVDDTTVLAAQEEDGGTRVTVTSIIRGGVIVSGMLKLMGKSSVEKVSKRIVANIVTLAQGGATHEMTSDEVSEIAEGRLGELKHRFKHE